MTDLTLPPFHATVTREVRWFRPGPIPTPVHEWFTSVTAEIDSEERTDWYDADFAHDGVGMKRRGTSTIEAKFRVMESGAVDLATGLTGRVEDWLKTSAPVVESSDDRGRHHLAIEKSVVTRRYPDSHADEQSAGCEAELVTITVRDHVAWSLCFETFGRPEDRFAAFDSGIRSFVADTPLPDGLAFNADDSRGYPDWISRLVR